MKWLRLPFIVFSLFITSIYAGGGIANQLAKTFSLDASRLEKSESIANNSLKQALDKTSKKVYCYEKNMHGCFHGPTLLIQSFLIRAFFRFTDQPKQLDIPGDRYVYGTSFDSKTVFLQRAILSVLLGLSLLAVFFAGLHWIGDQKLAAILAMSLYLFETFGNFQISESNDLFFFFWVVLFFIFTLKLLTRPGSRRYSVLFFLTGTLAAGTSITFILILVLSWFLFSLQKSLYGERLLLALVSSGIFFVIQCALIFLLNPSFLISYSESLSVLQRMLPLNDSGDYLLSLSPYAIWPAVWVFHGAFAIPHKWRKYHFIPKLFIFLMSLGILLFYKNRMSSSFLHLSLLTSLLVISIAYLSQFKQKKRKSFFILSFVYFAIVCSFYRVGDPEYFISELKSLPKLFKKGELSTSKFSETEMLAGNEVAVDPVMGWYIDEHLRPVIDQSKFFPDQVKTFDPFLDLNTDLKWADSTKFGNVVLGCRRYANSEKWFESRSERFWQKLADGKCVDRAVYNGSMPVQSYRNTISDEFIVLNRTDIRRFAPKAYKNISFEFNSDTRISSRFLDGINPERPNRKLGYEYSEDGKLELVGVIDENVRVISVAAESSCKTNAQITLKWTALGADQGKILERNADLNVEREACSHFGWACGLGLKNWYNRYFSIQNLNLELDSLTPGTKKGRLRIGLVGLNPDLNCRVVLGGISFQ